MAYDIALLSSPAILLAACLVVVAGSFVQAGLGMGFGLTAAPLLALIDPALVPAPVLCLGALTAAAAAWQERRAIAWREVSLGLLGRFFGILLATSVLAELTDPRTFSLAFGALVLVALLMVAFGRHLPLTRTTLAAAGLLSGFMGTITSIGAPPLALIYQSRKPEKSRPTMAAFFAIGASASLAGLLLSGWSSAADVAPVIVFLPAMLVGLFVARRLKGRFDRRYRTWLLALAGIASLLLIAKGLA